jgi:hypothetical protein
MNKTETKTVILFLFLFLFIFPGRLKAQVTIGNLSEPQSGALLDLKEQDIQNPGVDTPNSSKGVLFPKVRLVSSTSLSPLHVTTADPQTKTSKGMIVYNVNDAASGLKAGLCIWNGEEWSAIVGGGASSKIEINCAGKIVENGNLIKGNTLNATNTLILPVSVKQEGKYTIVAYSDPDNQYYFTATGEFLKKGDFNLILNGVGSPLQSTKDRGGSEDKIKIYINGSEYNVAQACPLLQLPELNVDDLAASYYFNCSQIDISNAELKTKKASTGSYITLRLQVPKEAAGAGYHIETNTVDGIKFEGSGTLFPGQQMVALEANGATPTVAGIHNFYFITNSTDPRMTNCSVEIPIFGRTIKVAIWGNISGDWDIGSTSKGARLMLGCSQLFGLGQNKNPIYPVESISVTHAAGFPALIDVDIVIISYAANPSSGSHVSDLADFINKGGVVIHCLENIDDLSLPNQIFSPSTISRGAQSGVGATVAILQSGNPLVNGEYMDISKKEIGYDGGLNLSFTLNDLTFADIVAIRDSDNKPTIIKHKTKPYVMLGDGGIFAGDTTPYTNKNHRPLLVDSQGVPVVRTGYDPGGKHNVYNAHLLANILIWAIKERNAVAP